MADRTVCRGRARSPRRRRSLAAAMLTGVLLLGQATTVASTAGADVARSQLGVATDTGIYVVNGDGSGGRRIVNMYRGGLAGLPGLVDGFTWAPSGRALAYAANRIGVGELRVTRPDGSRTRTIVTLPSPKVSEPAWSPDGSRIAFVAYTPQPPCFCPGATPVVYVTSPDGTTLLTLGPGWEPVWSPSGRKLAYNGFGRIHVIDLADPTRSRVVSPPEVWASEPAWAPTGGRLAFVGSRPLHASPSRVWVVRADGSRPRELPLEAEVVVWSPNGKRLATVTAAGIAVANADGSRARRVAGLGYGLVWVPDGSGITFFVYTGRSGSYTGSHGSTSVRVVTVDGSSERTIFDGLSYPHSLAWRP